MKERWMLAESHVCTCVYVCQQGPTRKRGAIRKTKMERNREKMETHPLPYLSLPSSLSLSLPPFPIPGPHTYTKIMCVKMTVVFFWEGDLFCLKRWTILLTRYSDEHKICQVGTSTLQNAWVRGVSRTINSKVGQNGPAVSGLQGQTYIRFSCCS